ncbi:MAG: glutathione S-transferase family protein [Rubrivivax sp.]
MLPLILHHYDGSPFSEKLRLMLGHKNLDWLSVKVPVIMPKPDVVALTGGYRRTPILQVGADIYCDSALMASVLEQRAPMPTFFPPDAALAPLLAQWADSTLFWTVIPYAMQAEGRAHLFKGLPTEALQAFAADRAPFTAGMRRQSGADAAANLAGYLNTLSAQVANGRPFLFGTSASIADFSVAHCLWYVRRAGPLADIIDRYPPLLAWLERVLAIGHGRWQKLSGADALAVAAAATSHAPTTVQPGLGFEAGADVAVAAIDYGVDPVVGTLVGLDGDEVVLRRTDDRAGTVHVHFPRRGFQIRLQQEQTA